MKESGQMERILRKWQPLAKPDCWQTGWTNLSFLIMIVMIAMMMMTMVMIAMITKMKMAAAMRVKKIFRLRIIVPLQKSYDSVVFQFPI